MKIPIEEDLKELLKYSPQCHGVACEDCPLHLKTRNEKYDTGCIPILISCIIPISLI